MEKNEFPMHGWTKGFYIFAQTFWWKWLGICDQELLQITGFYIENCSHSLTESSFN